MTSVRQRTERTLGARGSSHAIAQLLQHLRDQSRDFIVVLHQQNRSCDGGAPGTAGVTIVST